MPTYTIGTGKTYATIQDGVDAIPDNLSGGGVQTVEVYENASWDSVKCYYDESPDAKSGFSGFSSTDYVRIVAMKPNNGQRDTGIVVRFPVSLVANYGFQQCGYTRVEGFGVTPAAAVTGSKYLIGFDNYTVAPYTDGTWVVGCVIYDFDGEYYNYGIRIFQGNNASCWAVNNFIMNSDTNKGGFNAAVGIYTAFGTLDAARAKVYNNSIVNMHGYRNSSGSVGTCGIMVNSGFADWRNNVNGKNTGVTDFYKYGTCDILNYNNISQGTTATSYGTPKTGCLDNQDPDTDVKFTSTVIGSEDLHLQDVDSVAYGAGLAVVEVSTDIDGQIRVDPPCVGADEVFPSGVFHCGNRFGYPNAGKRWAKPKSKIWRTDL